ncbi:MAG: hypothetical protein RLZZ580_1856, partial [Cyanobacteriota bacterium]
RAYRNSRLGRDSLWFGWIRPVRLRKLSEPRIPRMRATGVSITENRQEEEKLQDKILERSIEAMQ